MNETEFDRREAQIRRWFSMWLCRQDTGIEELFAPDAVYIESWGPEYHGIGKIKLWFDEWNSRGTVERWDIRQFFHQGGPNRGGVGLPVCHDGRHRPEL